MPPDIPDFPPAAGHRFFVPPESWASHHLTLTGGEARHCAEVLRHRAGDRITAFDGKGREAACDITGTAKREVSLEIAAERQTPKPALELVLAQAVAKSKAMDWLIQKATEIGATRILPLTTRRTVVRIRPADASRHREKWERIALETAKQCTRAWLPEISGPQPLATFLKSPPATSLRLVASLAPGAQPLRSALASQIGVSASATVLVGPEGDFAAAELAAAEEAGFLPITLGRQILRSETAAISALSILAYELES